MNGGRVTTKTMPRRDEPVVGQFERMVPCVTGSVLKRIALWDCFGERCEKDWVKIPSKQSHSEIRHNPGPVSGSHVPAL